MRKIFLGFVGLFLSCISAGSGLASESGSEKGKVPTVTFQYTPSEEVVQARENNFYFEPGYEYSWVSIGARDTNWQLGTLRAAYLHQGLELPYFQFERYLRSGEQDLTFNVGGYYRCGEQVYLNLEAGVGSDVTYIYNWKIQEEIETKLFSTLFGKAGYKFLSYDAGDVQIPSVGLTYYRGQSYFIGTASVPFTEGRGSAYALSLKAHTDLNDVLGVYIGGAYGTRLYDIYDLPHASDQKGFIVFVGAHLKVHRNVIGRLGYLYAEEDPSFTTHTVNASVSIQF